MMKIALYGATGMIGSRILDEALRRGHTVTAIVRDPSRLQKTAPNLKVTAADILDPASVANVVAGADAVISAYAPPHDNPQQLLAAYHSLLEGLPQAGVKRVIVIGGAGSLEVAPGVQLVDTPEFPAAWKAPALAHRDVLNLFRSSAGALDWTYVSPAAFIQPGERTQKYRTANDTLITDENGDSRISTEDFAIAIVDEVEQSRHVKQRFTAAY
jgi:hypothetical protein